MNVQFGLAKRFLSLYRPIVSFDHMYKIDSIKSQKLLLTILSLVAILLPGSFTWAQCKGVKLVQVNLSELDRPCGATPSGKIALDIKGGLAPYQLTWKINGVVTAALPQTSEKGKLEIENIKGTSSPGYTVSVKDACGNQMTSAPLNLRNAPAIKFVSDPVVRQPNGNIIVELIGGVTPRTLLVTDSKGQVYEQQIPMGPPVNGKFKYEIKNLPPESYEIVIQSAAKNCTQKWKEKVVITELEH
jgi:hypothetical protein